MSGAARQRGRARGQRRVEDTEGTTPPEEEIRDDPPSFGEDLAPEEDTPDTLSQDARGAHAPRIGSALGESGVPGAMALTREEKHALLSEEIRKKRIDEEIVMMQQELAGEAPATYVAVAGTNLPHPGRTTNSGSGPAFLKQIKLGTPPSFSGKSVKELQTYEVGWKSQFKAMQEVASDEYAHRIATAATYLRGIALEAWARNNTTFDRWDDYMTFLRGIVADPATRKSEALLALASKSQKESQTPRELLAEIENLEQDIPLMTEDERRAWVLLNALRPALRAEVIRENKEITSREQVLASAQRHWEVTMNQTRAESRKPFRRASPMRPTSESYSRHSSSSTHKSRQHQPERHEPRPARPSWSTGCFNCGKPGHKANDCRSPPMNRTQGTGVTPAEPKN
jgi:hypothetical protein